MNKLLVVNKGDVETEYNISINESFDGLLEFLSKESNKKYAKICIVTDSNVAKFYSDEVNSLLNELDSTIYIHVFEAGEASKNLDTLSKLYEDLIKFRMDRNDLLVALGGGVVGDLTGFCAATYLRGIDYIQVPTTLLSQVDSSIGGKTAVDFMKYKNMVGAFYMPRLVYINVNTLKTLDSKQFSSGMGEVIKHGLIQDEDYYDYIIANKADIRNNTSNSLIELIYGSCLIKSRVVEEDPKEKGIRAYLNFGHTIGHAIEKLSNYSLFHGECVSLGMMSALYISNQLGYISEEEMHNTKDILEYFGLKTSVNSNDFDKKEILNATKSDKKMDNNHIKFVVLEEIGKAGIRRDISDEMLLDAIDYILE